MTNHPQTTRRVQLDLAPELEEWTRKRAAEMGLSRMAFIRAILETVKKQGE